MKITWLGAGGYLFITVLFLSVGGGKRETRETFISFLGHTRALYSFSRRAAHTSLPEVPHGAMPEEKDDRVRSALCVPHIVQQPRIHAAHCSKIIPFPEVAE